jgi:hypothetical protein
MPDSSIAFGSCRCSQRLADWSWICGVQSPYTPPSQLLQRQVPRGTKEKEEDLPTTRSTDCDIQSIEERHRQQRIGGLEMSKVRGGGAGEGVAEELDAHTIAQRWDVDKVQAFLATFRDE